MIGSFGQGFPANRKIQEYEKLEEGKWFEVELADEEEKLTVQVRGFWIAESDYTQFVTLLPKGANRAFDCLTDEIVSVKKVHVKKER